MAKYSLAADEAVRYALSKGFTLVRSRRHVVMRRGNRTVSFSKTPSDPRAILNIKRDIDRAVKEIESDVGHQQAKRNGDG